MAQKSLDPVLWPVCDAFKHIYSVPVYQRPYSWESQQISVLLDDITDSYELSKSGDDESYFIGSIYIYDTGKKLNGVYIKYDIIDGQQRITTLAILLLSIYSLALRGGIAETDQTCVNIKNCLWKCVKRSYEKENRAVTLNSIEKKCFSDIFDRCFDAPKDIRKYCEKYKSKSSFEKRVIENFIMIYDTIDNRFPISESTELLDFADYVLSKVELISIEATCSISKAFSIFESINSKGKPLDEIDKIKTYIFSQLDEESYGHYLELWGKLIIETKDNLYDYLYNYIKAYIYFYRQNISVVNFKSLCKDELLRFFGKTDVRDALKSLLEDMYDKIKYYNMLNNADDANAFINNKEFRFYYSIYQKGDYKHPKPLIMRCFAEYNDEKIKKQDLVDVLRETVKYMLEFLTISQRDSKDAITMFSTIMKTIYRADAVDRNSVISTIANELISKGITTNRLKTDLAEMDAYSQDKTTAALLALYESTTVSGGKVKTSYDKAYTLLEGYGRVFNLDHLLVQTPKKNNPLVKYYKDDDGKLVLKKGHDFGPDVTTGMDYDLFTRIVLNKIGNLRLYYSDENSARGNKTIQLNEYKGFNTYKKVQKRGNEIIATLVNNCLAIPKKK